MRRTGLPWQPACVLGLAALTACSPSDVQGPEPLSIRVEESGKLLLFTRNAAAEQVMAALFEGRVALDDAGCLRLEGPGNHTVVWPEGFSLTATAYGGLEVRDPGGGTVGRIGGRFRLGGGEVASPHEGIEMTDADRRTAREACPGRYWIVGEAL